MRGRNISNKNLKEIFEFIKDFIPQDDIEKRNKIILTYAFVDNMSSLEIAKLEDKRLIGFGNRHKGELLTGESIARIIKSYGLVKEKRNNHVPKSYDRRKALTNLINKNAINKPKICSCCGSTENLQLHHITPVSNGGSDNYYNLIYLCNSCHKKIHKEMRKNANN